MDHELILVFTMPDWVKKNIKRSSNSYANEHFEQFGWGQHDGSHLDQTSIQAWSEVGGQSWPSSPRADL